MMTKLFYLLIASSFYFSTPLRAFRNAENSDRIDDLRGQAEDSRRDAAHSFGDVVRDIVSGDWGSVPQDSKDYLDHTKDAETCSRGANVLEYCPEGYNDTWKP